MDLARIRVGVEHTKTSLALGAVVLLAVLAYWPGLGSGFVYDDFSNLKLLAQHGRVDDWHSFWLYIMSGIAGPTGRPLSMLSFLIDANHWPADPWPFKRTNLVIHCLNGLVLFALVRGLARVSGVAARKAAFVGILTAGVWLLHPLWVSTTLYAVQRMAMLSALFVLIGLWCWVELRRRRAPQLTWCWIVGGPLIIGIFGLIAVLSKENGALLPLFVAVLEGTILGAADRARGTSPSRAWCRGRLALLGLPIALIGAYLAHRAISASVGAPNGSGAIVMERLLTQTRVLWEYAATIALPQPSPGGLWRDDLVVSTGLLSPWTTLPALFALVATGTLAWTVRLTRPFLAAAILFFLAGHTIESTFIWLDMYYQHRSYLPAALAFMPVAVWWCHKQRLSPTACWLVPVSLLLLLAVMTGARSHLWSTPFQRALAWADERPDSPRTLNHLANHWQGTGHVAHARSINRKAIEADPRGLAWRISDIGYACQLNDNPQERIDALVDLLARTQQTDKHARRQLGTLLSYIQSGECSPLADHSARRHLIDRLADAAPDASAYQRLLRQYSAKLHLARGNGSKAFEDLRAIVSQTTNARFQLGAAAQLASNGYYEAALKILDMAPPQPESGSLPRIDDVRRWYLEQTGYYRQQRAAMRQQIRQDINREKPTDELQRSGSSAKGS